MGVNSEGNLVIKIMNMQNSERDLELKVTETAKSLTHENVSSYLDILNNDSKELKERYEAYLVLFTFYRRMKNTAECISLYDKYKDIFDKKFLFLHFYSIILKQTGNKRDLLNSISIARETIKIQPRHAGALHNLAGCLYILVESSELDEKERKKYLDESLELVDSAIGMERDYAKFYGTRAKIQCLRGRFEGAEKDVLIAIDKEDSSANDYGLRISDYLSIKMHINLNKAVNEVLINTKKEIQEVSDDVKKSNLEILSFFVAVISFVIGSITLAKGATTAEAIQ